MPRYGYRSVRHRTQAGIALLTVLWLLGLITLLAGSFSYMVRTETLLTKNLLQATRARQLAQAGLSRAIFEVLQPPSERTWRFDGAANREDSEAGELRIRVQNASGFIDLNNAQRSLLSLLFQHLELPLAQRDALVDTLLDWRDSNDLVRLNGAEDRAYRLAGRAYGAKDANFEREDELLQLLGMSANLYARVRPYVTVHSGQDGVNPAAADGQMLRLLTGGNEKLVSDLILSRDQNHASYEQVMADRHPGWALASASPVYLIRVEARSQGGASAYLEVGVAYEQGAGDYRIVSWNEARGAITMEQG